MSTTLKKITTEAKKIRKKHPAMKWITAVKQAGARYRSGALGKTKAAVKKRRKVGATKFVERGESRSAKPSAVYQRKRKSGRFDGNKKIGAVVSRASIKSYYKVALGNQLLKRELAKTKTDKRKVSKQIALTKKALHFLS